MINYFLNGFLYMIGSIRIAIIVYLILNVILICIGKRKFKKFFERQKKKMFFEFLLVTYMCTVLKITGVIGIHFNLPAHSSTLWNVIAIPFVGSNIKMVVLNVLMFVPYGVLLPAVFIKKKWEWKQIFLISFYSSLCIEILQLFGGRLCEIDDVIANTIGAIIGFLLLQSLKRLGSKKNNKQQKLGIVAFLVVVGVSAGMLFLLPSEDIVSSHEEEEFIEISNQKAMDSIEVFRVYDKTRTRDISKSSSRDTWYSWMGESISNVASKYVVQLQNDNMDEVLSSNNGPYIEVVFQNEQSFHLCNNEEWNLEHVKHLVYCVKDGTLWYGAEQDKLEYCAYYESIDGEFQTNEYLLGEIEDSY